ncbi:hypothetical protein [Rhodovastum atsumiense]|uniref:Uncharacterized protein n=1 Tax=Rhodovastum atsumiense TaxID=504468 RepID=A0A5M6ITH5_9PROT|nr:hypothetical protein [Rhodovastum atsumiense]KAA5611562.1 hypothetical protein F1189_13435 [Rhodovastum atsumiense]
MEPENLIIPEDGVTWEHPVPNTPLSREEAERLGTLMREEALKAEAEKAAAILRSANAGKENGNVVSASYGSGKSHMASTITNTLMENGKASQAAQEPSKVSQDAQGGPQDAQAPQSSLPPMHALPSEVTYEMAPMGGSLLGDVPQFTDADEIVPPPGGWPVRPAGIALGGASFALWITQPRGRLRADVVLVRAGQPPRVGDLVVVLEGKRVAAVGEMVDLNNKEATVTQGDRATGDDKRVFERGSVQLLKIAAAEFA